jgi:hypothetical protein
LASYGFRATVSNVSLARTDLPVGREVDSIGRVHVDHLDLTRHQFPFYQRIHDQERIAQDKPVCPVHFVLVELNLLRQRKLRVSEKLALCLFALDGPNDGRRRNSFVNVQGHVFYVKGEPLSFPGPNKLRV